MCPIGPEYEPTVRSVSMLFRTSVALCSGVWQTLRCLPTSSAARHPCMRAHAGFTKMNSPSMLASATPSVVCSIAVRISSSSRASRLRAVQSRATQNSAGCPSHRVRLSRTSTSISAPSRRLHRRSSVIGAAPSFATSRKNMSSDSSPRSQSRMVSMASSSGV